MHVDAGKQMHTQNFTRHWANFRFGGGTKATPLMFACDPLQKTKKKEPNLATTDTSLCLALWYHLKKWSQYFWLITPFSCEVSSVLFGPLTDWLIGVTWQTIQQRSYSSLFCRRPLWAVLAWAGMSTLWCCPSSISSADYGVARPPRSPEEWFWRGFRSVWHARTMQVSVSWQLPEEMPVDPQASWSCPAPSRWSCAPSRRYGECFLVHFVTKGSRVLYRIS